MGLQTASSRTNLPTWLLSAAANVVRKVEPSEYAEFYRLVSNARQTIMGSDEEWKPFLALLLETEIDRRDPNHLTALMIELLPKVVAQERNAYIHAVEKSRARLAEKGVQAAREPSEKSALTTSTASSTSINEGAERFAWALDRLSKK
jgi:hypothetical protein